MPVEAKNWYKSAAIWLNVGAAVALVLGILIDNALQLGIPAQWVAYAGTALAIVNGLLRLLRTSQPLSISGVVPSIRPPDLQPPTP